MELIILVTSKRVIGDEILKRASESLVKIRKVESSFLEEKILLDWEKLWRKRMGQKVFIQ